MKNQFRNPEWMKINRCIRSCTNTLQHATLTNLVLAYHEANKIDSGELLANFMTKQTELNPETI